MKIGDFGSLVVLVAITSMVAASGDINVAAIDVVAVAPLSGSSPPPLQPQQPSQPTSQPATPLACSADGPDPATCGDPNSNLTCGASCASGFCTGALDCSSLSPAAYCDNGECVNCQSDSDCGVPEASATCGAKCLNRLCQFQVCGDPLDAKTCGVRCSNGTCQGALDCTILEGGQFVCQSGSCILSSAGGAASAPVEVAAPAQVVVVAPPEASPVSPISTPTAQVVVNQQQGAAVPSGLFLSGIGETSDAATIAASFALSGLVLLAVSM